MRTRMRGVVGAGGEKTFGYPIREKLLGVVCVWIWVLRLKRITNTNIGNGGLHVKIH